MILGKGAWKQDLNRIHKCSKALSLKTKGSASVTPILIMAVGIHNKSVFTHHQKL